MPYLSRCIPVNRKRLAGFRDEQVIAESSGIRNRGGELILPRRSPEYSGGAQAHKIRRSAPEYSGRKLAVLCRGRALKLTSEDRRLPRWSPEASGLNLLTRAKGCSLLPPTPVRWLDCLPSEHHAVAECLSARSRVVFLSIAALVPQFAQAPSSQMTVRNRFARSPLSSPQLLASRSFDIRQSELSGSRSRTVWLGRISLVFLPRRCVGLGWRESR